MERLDDMEDVENESRSIIEEDSHLSPGRNNDVSNHFEAYFDQQRASQESSDINLAASSHASLHLKDYNPPFLGDSIE